MTLLAAVLCSLAVAADLGAVPRASAGSLSLKGNTVATSPGQWTWAGGPDRIAEVERVGVYGTKGVTAPENVPGARSGAATWVDTSGNFWLFGGRGFARHALLGTLNDLWKWDGASWTWVSGSDTYGRRGTYGEKGVAAPGNEPGARSDAVSWIDSAGNLWLFGGYGRDSASSYNVSLSDLWKWDGSDWTWVSGPIVGSRQGVYGTLGVAAPENCPGARYGATHWSGGDGSFWLFGGNGYGMSQYSSGLLNDLWKWNGSAWSWMGGSSGVNQPGVYGTKGIANPANVPGGRRNASANVSPDGTILLFGGYGQSVSGSGYLNDLWRWDGAEWIWVNGSDVPNQPGVYGTRGVPAPENVPGAREGSVAWMDGTGRFFLLGGFYSPTSNSWASLSDLWMWNGAGWVWVGGTSTPNQTGSYGVRGVPAAGNEPGARNGASAARDALGGVYVFGGDGASSTGSIGALNDFWRWNGSEWAWLSGTNGATLVGVYGTKGLANPTSHPGARRGAVTWLTANGETWLFGGHGYSAAGLGYLNDLWRWDGSSWTWMSGTNLEDQPAISGTKGIPAAENVPGARAWGVSWADSAGNLWLFGGRTPDVYDDGLLNDLWRWDGTNWTWVSGSLSPWKQGIYGTKGVPAPSNVPGSRSELTAWADATGNFWLFGGYGMAGGWFGDLNDLWRWDGTNWTWMHGSNDTDDSGSGGVLGEPSATNTPAARTGAIGSAAPDGTAWVHGGASGDHWLMDDLWRWDGTYWTRMSGTGTYFANGVYGEKGVAAPGNRPGARAWGASWADARGHFWLFGGSRSFGAGVYLNDLWRWDGVNWTWMSGSDAANASGVYGVAGTPAAGNSPGARDTAFAWKGNDGNFWIMNGFGADSAGVAGRLADLWAYEPPACSPPSATITAPDWILEGSGSHSASVANAGDGFTYEWTITGGTIDGAGNPGGHDLSYRRRVERRPRRRRSKGRLRHIPGEDDPRRSLSPAGGRPERLECRPGQLGRPRLRNLLRDLLLGALRARNLGHAVRISGTELSFRRVGGRRMLRDGILCRHDERIDDGLCHFPPEGGRGFLPSEPLPHRRHAQPGWPLRRSRTRSGRFALFHSRRNVRCPGRRSGGRAERDGHRADGRRLAHTLPGNGPGTGHGRRVVRDRENASEQRDDGSRRRSPVSPRSSGDRHRGPDPRRQRLLPLTGRSRSRSSGQRS
ncbi:MAG: hypothetical protein IPF66_00330 [Holophagales bacterium]|nr:hypothetical protein [Holophagales bacterium]